MDFKRGQKVWTPEVGWAKFERALLMEPDYAWVIKSGQFHKVRVSTLASTEYNKAAADELVPYVKSICITCQPSAIDLLTRWMSENSSLSEITALDYVLPTTEASHGAKFDIYAPDAPQELLRRLGVPLDSRNLAGWLMKEHNLLPVKRVLCD